MTTIEVYRLPLNAKEDIICIPSLEIGEKILFHSCKVETDESIEEVKNRVINRLEENFIKPFEDTIKQSSFKVGIEYGRYFVGSLTCFITQKHLLTYEPFLQFMKKLAEYEPQGPFYLLFSAPLLVSIPSTLLMSPLVGRISKNLIRKGLLNKKRKIENLITSENITYEVDPELVDLADAIKEEKEPSYNLPGNKTKYSAYDLLLIVNSEKLSDWAHKLYERKVRSWERKHLIPYLTRFVERYVITFFQLTTT